MKETQLFLAIGIPSLIVLIAVFDIWIIAKRGKRESISAYIIRSKSKFIALLIPLFTTIGFVGGHLFWSMSDFDWKDPKDLIRECKQYIEEHDK